jgi:malate synthase
MEIFDRQLKGPNQLNVLREDVKVTAADLLRVPEGKITERGLRTNVNVGLLYLESWLRGSGCVPIYNLMEDAATAEICRTQIWQWIRHPRGVLENGTRVTADLFRRVLDEELEAISSQIGSQKFGAGKFTLAARLIDEIVTTDDFVEFLTLPAYENLE